MKSEKAKNRQKVAVDACPIDPFDEWGLTFDAIPDQIALIDRDMRLTRVNKAFAQQYRKRPNDFIGEPCYKHICRSTEPNGNCPHLRTVRDGKSYSIDLHLEHLGGDYLIRPRRFALAEDVPYIGKQVVATFHDDKPPL